MNGVDLRKICSGSRVDFRFFAKKAGTPGEFRYAKSTPLVSTIPGPDDRHAMCLPSGPETQEIHFYPIPTEYEAAHTKVSMIASAE